MLQGDDYKISLKNNINKADFINPPLGLPTGAKIGERSRGDIVNWIPESSRNHKEADTCIMYHCTLEDKPTSVIYLDANTFILMVHVFASHLPDHDWILRTQKNHFLNASKIHDYIGNAVTITLPAMFITTSYLLHTSSVRPRSLYLNRS